MYSELNAQTTGSTPSERGTIHEILEEIIKPEPSFMTALGSFSISANPAGFGTPSFDTLMDRRGHILDTSGDTFPWN
jgi:hypothetical protein